MKHVIRFLLILSQLLALEFSAQPDRSPADIAFTITRMAEIYHVQPRTVDKSFSADLFSQMIKALDPDKIYLSGEDIKQLSVYQFKLDDQLLNRKDDFLKLLINIYIRKKIRQIQY